MSAEKPASSVGLATFLRAGCLFFAACHVCLADTGALRVTIAPPGAVAAGAQWRVGAGPWRESGAIESEVPAGFQLVTLRHTLGWGTPPSQPVTIVAGQLVEGVAAYREPAEAVLWGSSSGELWKIPWENTEFVAVASGNHGALALRADGSVEGWGSCLNGPCYGPSPIPPITAIASYWWNRAALRVDGSILAWGTNVYGQHNVPSPNTDFIALAAGERHILGLKTDGSIVAWGSNTYGQCNVPAPNSGYVAVAAGRLHSIALKSDGSVLAWGYNTYGQCDVPSIGSPLLAITAGDYHTAALTIDGSLVAWGRNEFGQCDVPSPNMGFVSIGAGWSHTLGVKSDGSVVAFGRNDDQQCEPPTPNLDFLQVVGGGGHSLALRKLPKGACCFDDQSCAELIEHDCGVQLGYYQGHDSTCSPGRCAETGALVVTLSPPEAAAAGAQWRVGTGPWRSSGEIEPTIRTGTQIISFRHTIGWVTPRRAVVAVVSQQMSYLSAEYRAPMEIVAWGDNQGGQCDVPFPNSDFVATAAGVNSFGIRDDGSIVEWPPHAQPTPNAGFVKIVPLNGYVVALKADGSILVRDWYGEWGTADVPPPNAGFVDIAEIMALREDGSIVVWGIYDPVDLPPTPNSGFVALGGRGPNHSAALRANGSIVTWGRASAGLAPLSVPTPNAGFSMLTTVGYSSVALRHDGSLEVWPQEYDLSPNLNPNTGFIDIASNFNTAFHRLALRSDGSITAWGWDNDGQATPPTPNSGFVALSAGMKHSLALAVRPRGACCFSDGSCVVTGSTPCANAGGAYRGDGTSCVPNDCPQPPFGACCFMDGVCIERQEIQCSAAGGVYQGAGGTCEPNPCPQPSELTVSLAPQGAASAGARWRIGTGPWRGSGESEPAVPIGQHIISFKSTVGWITPANLCVTMQGQPIESITVEYPRPAEVIPWGSSGSGQLSVPPPSTGFTALAAGVSHSLGLRADGSVAAWGLNSAGQCDIPLPNADFVALAANEGRSIGLKSDGSVVNWGAPLANPPQPNIGFVGISLGDQHALAVRTDGSIAAWGVNSDGQCEVPQPNTDFIAVAAGARHSLGLKRDGTVAAWGYWQYGVPTTNAGFLGISAGRLHSVGRRFDGSLAVWGDCGFQKCAVPAPNTGFVAVAAGRDHSVGLKSDGSVVAWGDNWSHQCDVPVPNMGGVAVAAGAAHSLALGNLPLGACCFSHGECSRASVPTCAASNGMFLGVGTSCAPNPCPLSLCAGDLDCDRAVNFLDIDPFVLALSGEDAYLAAVPTCRWLNADCDGDGDVDFFDIDSFVALIGTTCP